MDSDEDMHVEEQVPVIKTFKGKGKAVDPVQDIDNDNLPW